MTDVLFFGELPLLLSGESRPPVIACGVIAPSWTDPAFSIFTGPDGAPEGRARNIADNEKFLSLRAPGYRYIDAVLDRLGVTISGGYKINRLYRLPDFSCNSARWLLNTPWKIGRPTSSTPVRLSIESPVQKRLHGWPCWIALCLSFW
jgi:hypothetical protein